jgi:hypothetical protein
MFQIMLALAEFERNGYALVRAVKQRLGSPSHSPASHA